MRRSSIIMLFYFWFLFQSEWDRVGSPMASCMPVLDQWISRAFSSRWSTPHTCATARLFWSRAERRISSELLALSKIHLATIVVVLTGHCPIGIQTVSLKILTEASCLYCMEEGEVETSRHFLLHCPLQD